MNRLARYRELNRQTKTQLAELYRELGYIGGLHPLEKWTKEEIIHGIIDIEQRRRGQEEEAAQAEQPTCETYAQVDVTEPYGYRVVRMDNPEKPWTFTTGYVTRPDLEQPVLTAAGAAQRAAANSRVGHSYYGPLRVYVWPQREQENYRMPVPDDAAVYDFPAQPMLNPARAYVD